MADPIRPSNVGHRDIGQYRNREEVFEALRSGDTPIAEIIAKSHNVVSKQDIENFLRRQSHEFRSDVMQEQPVYSAQGDMPPPSPEMFTNLQDDQELSDEDRELLFHGMAMGAKAQVGKSVSLGKAEDLDPAASDPNAPQTLAELEAAATRTVSEVDSTLFGMMGDVIDQQMRADMERKLNDVKSEISQVINTARANGTLTPELLLICYTKVALAKSGSMMVWKGKQMAHTNEEMNRATESLSSNPAFGEVQAMQNTTREGGMTMQRLTTDMQQITTHVATVLESVKSIIDDKKRKDEQIAANINIR